MENQHSGRKKEFSLVKLVLIAVAVATLTSVFTIWLMMRYFFPSEFKPVNLTAREERVLQAKIDRLDAAPQTPATVRNKHSSAGASQAGKTDALEPERYTEDDVKRRITFSERELNALVARNTDLASKLAIDLSDDLASAKLLVPLDPDLPFVGGKTLKVTAGLELRYADQKPVVILKGISFWGVPVPNAWLGGIKNVDLVKEFGAGGGFWQLFSAGVAYVQVQDGQLILKLKE